MNISSYASPLAVGHKLLGDRFWEGSVVVQEKIDGSQLSFMVDNEGLLHLRSHHKDIDSASDSMFGKALTELEGIKDKLIPGLVYRGEYIPRPRANALTYSRTPAHYVIIFDIENGNGTSNYFSYESVRCECQRIGLEVVPTYHVYVDQTPTNEELKAYLDNDSILGGVRIEGIVLKNYERFGEDHKVLMAKLVSKDFQEVHSKTWRADNPNKNDVIENIITMYGTEARFQKAVQHLTEDGKLVNAPQDIPVLMKEVIEDVMRECGDEIKDMLFKVVWKQYISRGITRGLPEWYKAQLAS